MIAEDNVVKMPDPLERRAQKIEAALTRQDDADARSEEAAQDWREATLELAVELFGAKTDLRNNTKAFGEWCEKRFGDNRLPKDDRGALVRWGSNPDGTRKMLASEISRSIQVIDRRVRTPTNSPVTTPDREKAKDIIRAHKAEFGVYPTVIEAGKASGKSRIVVEPALAAVIAEDRVAPSEVVYTKAQDRHVEARIKAGIAAGLHSLEKEIDARVTKETKARIDLLFPGLEKMRDEARRNERLYRELIEKQAILTESECLDIIKACHPDNSASAEVRQRAFIAINAKKLQLTGKK